jgi:hypothetical protein
MIVEKQMECRMPHVTPKPLLFDGGWIYYPGKILLH